MIQTKEGGKEKDKFMKTYQLSYGKNKDCYVINLNNGETRQFKKKRLFTNTLAFLVKDGYKQAY